MLTDSQEPYTLYVLMRDDLESMNAGKAMAQANHAYGALKKRVRSHIALQKDYIAWQNQTDQDFGTVIVLAAAGWEITKVLRRANKFYGKVALAGWINDPTYPIKDGKVTHLINLNTCAYVFCTKEIAADLVGHLGLHP